MPGAASQEFALPPPAYLLVSPGQCWPQTGLSAHAERVPMVPVEAAGFKAALRHWLPIASAARGGTVAGAPRIEWCYRAPDVSWRGMYFRATKLIATAEPSTILAAADSRPCTRRRSSGTKPCLLLLLHGAGRYVCVRARACACASAHACVRSIREVSARAVLCLAHVPATWGPNAHAHSLVHVSSFNECVHPY